MVKPMKISIRFFNDKEVHAAWNEENNKWYFSVLDIIGAIKKEDNYEKCRNYWKYLKAKLKKENSELVTSVISWIPPIFSRLSAKTR